MFDVHIRQLRTARKRIITYGPQAYTPTDAIQIIDAVLALLDYTEEQDRRLREHQGDPHAHELIP